MYSVKIIPKNPVMEARTCNVASLDALHKSLQEEGTFLVVADSPDLFYAVCRHEVLSIVAKKVVEG